MPKFICKFTEGDQSWYLEWSTVVDAPTVFGMSLEEFKEYYKDEYGRQGMWDFDKRLERVEAKGTSSMMHNSVEEVISGNRAGKDETELTLKQIISYYCKYPTDEEAFKKHQEKKPKGKKHNYA